MTTTPSRYFGMVIVRGNSMLPTLCDGQRLLVRYGRLPRPGRLVVARLPDGTVVIKRAVERRAAGWWLLSDNAAVGLGDSRAWGPVPETRMLAVVIARLWPRPSRLPRQALVRTPAADPELWNEDGAVPRLMAHDRVAVERFWQAMGFRAETEQGGGMTVRRSGVVLRYDLVESMDVRRTHCVAFVRTDDVDALHCELAATDVWRSPATEPDDRTTGFDERLRRGESIARLGEPIDRDWGMREFRLFDPSNNLIRFAQA